MPELEEPDSPISLSRFNIKPIPPRIQQTYFFGKIRAFNTFTTLEWIYLGVSLVALTVCLGITIERLTKEKPDESDFTFAILLLVTILFCYHYVVHSLFTECWDELMVFVVSNIIVLVYCVLNYFNKDASNQSVSKMVRLIFVCTLSPFLIVVGIIQSYKYCISNNLLYNTVGGISALQNACRMFLICVSLLKFDLQLQISMVILIMSKGVTSLNLEQKVILGSGIPVTVLFVIVGYLGLRFENIPLMVVFYILGLLDPIYVVYKIIYTAQHDYNNDAIRDSTFACGYFALVIWVLLFVSTLYFTRYYFKKGLKEKMFGTDTATLSQSAGTVNEAVISE